MGLNKYWIFSFIIVLIALIIFVKNESERVCINGNCFIVEVVDTPQSREVGLMNRAQLDENKGMFFVFENEGNYPFWMKNTLIPLDMIWMDSSGKIVDIKEADPCTSDPCQVYYHMGSAKYVLEVNKGLSAELGINVGDIVESKRI